MASVVDRFGDWLERRGLLTWERRGCPAGLLTITNLWPHDENRAYGPFVKRSVDGLDALGVVGDVLFIRGYKGLRAYVAAAAFVGMLRATKRYALVHAHGGETALVARLYTGAPVVASYLGSDLLAPREGGRRIGLGRRVRSVLLRRHAELMTATTTKTREMEDVLPRRARERNRVVADGIELDRFTPIDQDLAREYLGWPLGSTIVLFCGRAASPVKRLWLAEQAVSLARIDLEGLQLMIASGVEPDEMPYYYAAADCLLHTSASEGSPNVIKEALACNLPIVAAPAGDIERLVAGARPGAVVEADAHALAREVIRCCRSPSRSNGRDLTGGMTLQRAAAATLDLYASLSDRLAISIQASSTEAVRLEPVLTRAGGNE
jgi:teichuronic acid biosynthesis glycosyltransferase TuaC